MSSEPPEEPQFRNKPKLMSPTSPKPIHFPTPTSIPVLEMQTDVGFNQTEAHMSDPATRNTEVRADLWRDPKEALTTTHDASPYSTGAEAMETIETDGNDTADSGPIVSGSDSTAATINAQHTEPVPNFNFASNHTDANGDAAQFIPASSDLSVPAAEVTASEYDSSQPAAEVVGYDQTTTAHPFNGTVNVQALLDSLQTAPASATPGASTDVSTAPEAEGITVSTTASPLPPAQTQLVPLEAAADGDGTSSPLSASGLGALPSGLPPRPPPQEQPLIHPNYVHSQHIRDYHPHAAHPAFQPHGRTGSQGNVADPTSRNYVPPVHTPSSGTQQPYGTNSPSLSGGASFSNEHQQVSGYAPGTDSYNLTQQSHIAGFAASPQNMYAAQFPSATNTPTENRRDTKTQRGDEPKRPEDRPWNAEVQRKYDRFIEDERRYVSEGRWEQFPVGSRLFVGNLSSEKVTKRDIFHVFHTYGDLAQISIKQAYGFVQFLRTEDCNKALVGEEGTQIRDKKIHLEVSKPQTQKNRQQTTQRRSRSPPGGRPGANVDRYVSGSRGGNGRGSRDGYRSGYRSPSPRNYRDRYDERYRTRSRSPGFGRNGRFRSPSPRRDADDDLPLPKRAPRDVPEVQIIVLDSLDRDFISWVEKAFSSSNVRVDVLLLSPRLSEEAVIRRQIMEGVVAVVKLTRQNQNNSKIGLQIFDRSQGANNVKFEEYDGLEPGIAAQLVLRAKQTHAPAAQPNYGAYGAPQYGAQPPQYGGYGATPAPYGQTPQHQGYPPGYGQPQQHGAPPGVPPNLQNLITNLDPNNLQNLLSAMGTPQSATGNPYGNVTGSQPNSAIAAQLQNNPALAGYLQQQQQQQQAQQPQSGAPGSGGAGGVNMQEILARLGNYQR